MPPSAEPGGALDGLLILDVSGTVATAYCAKQLADYGAEVINLEPACGFITRYEAPFIAGVGAPENSALHAYLSANKRSIQIDSLSDEALEDLLFRADLLLDDACLPERITGLKAPHRGVRMSISWYGEDGPYAGFTGSDAQIFALNGMLRNIGTVDGPPIIPTGYAAQIVAGMTAYIGALGHVLAAELGNKTIYTHLHTSIFEACMCFTDVGAINYYNSGLQAQRLGINRYPPTAPMGVYPCQDGWVGITVLTPSQWHAFCDLLELHDLKDVPLFQTAIGRFEAIDLIEPKMCEQLLKQSAEALFYRGQELAIPLARVPTMEELFSVDQFVERQAFSAVELRGGETVTVPSVPFRLYATPPHFGGAVATLGQHNDEVSNAPAA